MIVAQDGTNTTSNWDLPCHDICACAGNSTLGHCLPGVFHDVLDLAMSIETTHALAWWSTHYNIHITCRTGLLARVLETATEESCQQLA